MSEQKSPLREWLQSVVEEVGLEGLLEELSSILMEKATRHPDPTPSKLYKEMATKVREFSESIPDLLTGKTMGQIIPPKNFRVILIVFKENNLVYRGTLTKPNLVEATLKSGKYLPDERIIALWDSLQKGKSEMVEDRWFTTVKIL